MWAQLEVPEADASAVRAGQRVTLTFEGMGGESREATLTRVGNSVDPATRTVRAAWSCPIRTGPSRRASLRARVQVAAEHEALLGAARGHPARRRTRPRLREAGGGPVPARRGGAGGGTREHVEVLEGLDARGGSRHHGRLPAQDGDPQGVASAPAAARASEGSRHAHAESSTGRSRHRLVCPVGLGVALIVSGLLRVPRPAHRRLPGHDAGPGAGQHRRPGPRPGGGRAADHLPDRAGARRLPRLEELRSVSKFGLSQVAVIFEDGTDIYFARQLVTERLDAVELPAGHRAPEAGPGGHRAGRGVPLRRHRQGRQTRPSCAPSTTGSSGRSCARVPGVAEVNAWGGYEKQYQVRSTRDRLRQARADVRRGRPRPCERNNRNVGGGIIARRTAQSLPRPRAGPHGRPRADRGHRRGRAQTACRSASATWPTWRSGTRSAAGRVPPTARARSCSASAS